MTGDASTAVRADLPKDLEQSARVLSGEIDGYRTGRALDARPLAAIRTLAALPRCRDLLSRRSPPEDAGSGPGLNRLDPREGAAMTTDTHTHLHVIDPDSGDPVGPFSAADIVSRWSWPA